MRNFLKSLFFLVVFTLISCGGQEHASESKIINGYVQTLNQGGDDRGLAFNLGFSLSNTKNKSGEKYCSGFRYGYNSIITAAHCIFEQVAISDDSEVYIDIVTGTATALTSDIPVKIEIHKKYSDGCLDLDYGCPDIAVIVLPTDISNNPMFISMTEPAEIDFLDTGFPKGESPILTGFGCSIDDFYLTGGCNGETFKKLTYSIADNLRQKTSNLLELPTYYFQVEGKNTSGADFAVGSGDSGGPLVRLLKNPKTLRPGDTRSVMVDAIAIYKKPAFLNGIGYPNILLDLANPVVANWLRPILDREMLASQKDTVSVNPILAPDITVCSPSRIDISPGPQPFEMAPWTSEKLNNAPQILADNLNALRNGRTRAFLGLCVKFIEDSITKVEANGSPLGSKDDVLATLYYARFNYLQFLEIMLEMQNNSDAELEVLARLHQIQIELQLRMLDVLLSGTPGVSTVYDLYILTNHENVLGEVTDLEYNITAATLIVPGVLKAGANAFTLTRSTLSTATRIAGKVEKYAFKSGRLTEVLARSAIRIGKSEEAYFAFIKQTKSIGIESAAQLRELVRVGKIIDPACDFLGSILETSQVRPWQQYLELPLLLIEQRAYAEPKKCSKAVIGIFQKFMSASKQVGDGQLEGLIKKISNFCLGKCDVIEVADSFAGGTSIVDLGKIIDSAKSVGADSAESLKFVSEFVSKSKISPNQITEVLGTTNVFKKMPKNAPEFGGFKYGIDGDQIREINKAFGGLVELNGVIETGLTNAANYTGFYNKSAAIIQKIAKGHLFDNGNKRTAAAVFEILQIRNGVFTHLNHNQIESVINKISTGDILEVENIAKALQGL